MPRRSDDTENDVKKIGVWCLIKITKDWGVRNWSWKRPRFWMDRTASVDNLIHVWCYRQWVSAAIVHVSSPQVTACLPNAPLTILNEEFAVDLGSCCALGKAERIPPLLLWRATLCIPIKNKPNRSAVGVCSCKITQLSPAVLYVGRSRSKVS